MDTILEDGEENEEEHDDEQVTGFPSQTSTASNDHASDDSHLTKSHQREDVGEQEQEQQKQRSFNEEDWKKVRSKHVFDREKARVERFNHALQLEVEKGQMNQVFSSLK